MGLEGEHPTTSIEQPTSNARAGKACAAPDLCASVVSSGLSASPAGARTLVRSNSRIVAGLTTGPAVLLIGCCCGLKSALRLAGTLGGTGLDGQIRPRQEPASPPKYFTKLSLQVLVPVLEVSQSVSLVSRLLFERVPLGRFYSSRPSSRSFSEIVSG
jgi:hypothetical protein